MLPKIHKNTPLSAGSQALPSCPDMSSIQLKTRMEQWWNDNDKENEVMGEKPVKAPLCPS